MVHRAKGEKSQHGAVTSNLSSEYPLTEHPLEFERSMFGRLEASLNRAPAYVQRVGEVEGLRNELYSTILGPKYEETGFNEREVIEGIKSGKADEIVLRLRQVAIGGVQGIWAFCKILPDKIAAEIFRYKGPDSEKIADYFRSLK